MKDRFLRCITAAISVALLPFATNLRAENGVSDSEIIVGQTAVFSGPASALGLGMRAGLSAAIAQINASGGVQGRKIKLVTKDDQYEPLAAISNTKELISTDKVFALIGGVGTPTANAIVPICEENSVPFIGPFTGAGALRTPFKKFVVNLRASYGQEMEALAAHLVDGKKTTKIACFYQNDGYGQAGLAGLNAALKKRGLELVSSGTYERNTTAVKAGLLEIKKGAPDAVVLVGTYKACADFIRLARQVGMKETIYCNISFVGTRALMSELAAEAEGIIVSQVVPLPSGDTLPILKEYQQALKNYSEGQTPDWISLEGYLVGRFFAEVLGKAGKAPTRESFLKAIQDTKTFDLGGFPLVFGPDDHQGSDSVYLTISKGGEVVALK